MAGSSTPASRKSTGNRRVCTNNWETHSWYDGKWSTSICKDHMCQVLSPGTFLFGRKGSKEIMQCSNVAFTLSIPLRMIQCRVSPLNSIKMTQLGYHGTLNIPTLIRKSGWHTQLIETFLDQNICHSSCPLVPSWHRQYVF